MNLPPACKKYAGVPINRVPSFYVSWLAANWNETTLREAAQTEMARRSADGKATMAIINRQKSAAIRGGLFKDAPLGDGAKAPGQTGVGHDIQRSFEASAQLRGMTEKEREEFFKEAGF